MFRRHPEMISKEDDIVASVLVEKTMPPKSKLSPMRSTWDSIPHFRDDNDAECTPRLRPASLGCDGPLRPDQQQWIEINQRSATSAITPFSPAASGSRRREYNFDIH